MRNFTKTQTKFVNLINNSKLLNKMPHALMIEGSSSLLLDKAVEYTIASLLCEHVEPCFNCEVCSRVLQGNITDVIIYDLSDNTLRKEYVLDIQHRFSKTALEETNKQIYVIKYIENSTSIALNSLLKFLEEPNDNVYAIFTTRNIEKVLDTIVSRSIVYRLAQNNIDQLKEIYYGNFTKVDVDLVSLITNDEVFMERVLTSEVFKKFKENINQFFSSLFIGDFFIIVNELLSDCEKDELSIFFELFYVCLINVEYLALLGVKEEMLEKIHNKINYDKLLDTVLSSRLQLNTNMNKALLIDKFSIEAEEAILW